MMKNEPLRILQLPNTLSKNSGIMGVIMNYYRHLDREEIQFDFLCFKTNDFDYYDEINSLGGRVFYLDNSLIKLKYNIEKFLKQNAQDYSILHYHAISIWGCYMSLFESYGIKNRIIHSHNANYGDGFVKRFRNRLLVGKAIRNCNYFFSCSEKAGKFLFGSMEKVYLIRNAVDLNDFRYNEEIRRNKRKELELDEKIVLGHVGRLSQQKNHEFLIDLFNYLYLRDERYHLLLIGSGDLKINLLEKVRVLGIQKNVTFLGSSHEVNNWMQAMDVFVMPSLYEGLPVVGIEAQATGLPCVFSASITEEVGIANFVFKDLNEPIKVWADTVKLFSSIIRCDMSSELSRRGYDITEESYRLMEVYREMVRL